MGIEQSNFPTKTWMDSELERNDVARQCAITLCWDYAGLSHSELANLFGYAQQRCGSPDNSTSQGKECANFGIA
jgi:hypothetical protein